MATLQYLIELHHGAARAQLAITHYSGKLEFFHSYLHIMTAR